MRTAQALGIKCVAVFSEADANSMHVKMVSHDSVASTALRADLVWTAGRRSLPARSRAVDRILPPHRQDSRNLSPQWSPGEFCRMFCLSVSAPLTARNPHRPCTPVTASFRRTPTSPSSSRRTASSSSVLQPALSFPWDPSRASSLALSERRSLLTPSFFSESKDVRSAPSRSSPQRADA